MMKKLVALSLAAVLSSNAFAGTNVETENLKKAAAAVAEKTVALKAAGLTDTEVLAVMEQDINNMTGDATTPVVKNNKKVVVGIVLGALAAAGAVYGGYKLYRHFRPATTTPVVENKQAADNKPAAENKAPVADNKPAAAADTKPAAAADTKPAAAADTKPAAAADTKPAAAADTKPAAATV